MYRMKKWIYVLSVPRHTINSSTFFFGLILILACLAVTRSYGQETITFPAKITKFVKIDSLDAQTMYLRAEAYYSQQHYVLPNRKRTKFKNVHWMTSVKQAGSVAQMTTSGFGVIFHDFHCLMGKYSGYLRFNLSIKIMEEGIEYTIENMEHKSQTGTYDFGPLVNEQAAMHQVEGLYPLFPGCWADLKKSALIYSEKIGYDITQKITLGRIIPSEYNKLP